MFHVQFVYVCVQCPLRLEASDPLKLEVQADAWVLGLGLSPLEERYSFISAEASPAPRM